MRTITTVIVIIVFITGCSSPPSTTYHQAADARIDLGLAYLHNNERNKARANLVKARQLAPDYLRAHLAYLFLLETLGEHSEADADYHRLLADSPNNSYLLNNYATFLCRQHDFIRARQNFMHAMSRPHPQNIATIYLNAGLCELSNQQITTAEKWLRKAVTYDQTQLIALEQLIQMDLKSGQLEAATLDIHHYEQLGGRQEKSRQWLQQLFLLTSRN